MTEHIRKWAAVLFTREIISYLICGVLTTLLSIVVYAVCERLDMSTTESNTVATAIAIVFAYVVNKIFVFESHVWRPWLLLKEIAAFASARLLTYLLETGLLILMVDRMGLWSLGSKTVSTVIVILLNYVLSKKAVFKGKG